MKTFSRKFLLPFIAFMAIASMMSTNVAAATNLPVVAVFGAITTATIAAQHFRAPNVSVHMHGIEVEVWVNYIKEKLFKTNAFLAHATDHDDKVLGGKVVHLPQAGNPSDVVKNRSSFPAVAVRRTDTDITYALDAFTTDPVHITLNELAEISYDKIDSAVGQDMANLAEVVADEMIVKWLDALPQANIVRTTGADSADALLDGATGTRKLFTEKDLRRAAKAVRKQNVKDQLFVLLSTDMEDQLKDSLSQTQSSDYSRYYDAKNGIIGRLHGVNILERSSVSVFGVSGSDQVVKPVGASVAAADNDGGLLWAASAVGRAWGETYLFQDQDNPLYYGDIYSALLRAGGRRTRQDDKGVVAIVQSA